MVIPTSLCSPIIDLMIKFLVFGLLTVICHVLDFDLHNLPPHHRPVMKTQPRPIGTLAYPVKVDQARRYRDLPLRIHRAQSTEYSPANAPLSFLPVNILAHHPVTLGDPLMDDQFLILTC